MDTVENLIYDQKMDNESIRFQSELWKIWNAYPMLRPTVAIVITSWRVLYLIAETAVRVLWIKLGGSPK